ncbi:MAG: histidine phosphatase family protein [Defluviitaleaceae bacterium]|nr:histidine phosphatase family protein [Defluviitaleaceae bacterium]
MTTIYFIRHAEADNTISDSRVRPLTQRGLDDRQLVTDFLADKKIEIVLSSPYKRAIDTIAGFADKHGFEIETIEDFRERASDSVCEYWDSDDNRSVFIPEKFADFSRRQWTDFSYTLSDGECLSEVQARNIAALNQVLERHKDKIIVIGTHGTALSTIINHYDSTYGFEDYMAMVYITPWVVRMDFDDKICRKIEKIDLFDSGTNLGSQPDHA